MRGLVLRLMESFQRCLNQILDSSPRRAGLSLQTPMDNKVLKLCPSCMYSTLMLFPSPCLSPSLTCIYWPLALSFFINVSAGPLLFPVLYYTSLAIQTICVDWPSQHAATSKEDWTNVHLVTIIMKGRLRAQEKPYQAVLSHSCIHSFHTTRLTAHNLSGDTETA